MRISELDKKQIINSIPFLLIPMLLSIFVNGGLLNVLAISAAYMGFKYKPTQIWPIWLVSVGLLWATYGLSALFSIIPFEEGGETWWSFAIEAFFFMGLLVAAPTWLGRWFAKR